MSCLTVELNIFVYPDSTLMDRILVLMKKINAHVGPYTYSGTSYKYYRIFENNLAL